MAEAVLGTHDDWQIGKTKIFLKVSAAYLAATALPCPAVSMHGMFPWGHYMVC